MADIEGRNRGGIQSVALLPIPRQREIEVAIADLAIKFGSCPEVSILDICRRLEISVKSADIQAAGVRAAIGYEDNKSYIILNAAETPERKTFSLAHELGHYILHPHLKKFHIDRYNYSSDSDESLKETEANFFAASILVPKYKLVPLLTEGIPIQAIADFFAVSKEVIAIRIQWINKNG